MIRAANTGISAIIDARGRVLERLETGVSGVLTAALPRLASPTLYGRYSDLLFAMLIAGLMGATACFVRKQAPDKILT